MQLDEEDIKSELRGGGGYQEVRVREGYEVREAVCKVSFKIKERAQTGR